MVRAVSREGVCAVGWCAAPRRGAAWLQVGLTTLKGGSAISANAQSLHVAASAENIRLCSSTERKSLIRPHNLPPGSKSKPIIIGNWPQRVYNVFITCLKRILIQIDLFNDYQPLDFSSDNKNKFEINLKDSVFGLKNDML